MLLRKTSNHIREASSTISWKDILTRCALHITTLVGIAEWLFMQSNSQTSARITVLPTAGVAASATVAQPGIGAAG